MKASNLWRTITREQRRAWSAWAKNNKVLLDDGNRRRVSGRKAMSIIVRNRGLAGDAPNPAAVPAAGNWLDGTLSLRDAGPFSEGGGYIGFRPEQDLAAGTKWFVWASAMALLDDPQPLATMRFLGVLAPPALSVAAHDVTPSMGANYMQLHGDWRPVFDPELDDIYAQWHPPRKIWFRLHHYVDGALSPGLILGGTIIPEL